MMRPDAIRSFVENHGVKGYLKEQAKMLGLNPDGSVPRDANGHAKLRESTNLPNGTKVERRSPRQFSILALWEGLVGDRRDTLSYFRDQAGLVTLDDDRLQEAVSTGAFPSAVGQLIASEVIEAYEMTEDFIGDQLVRTMESSLRGEEVVGMTAAQGPEEVLEGESYPEASFAEKTVGTRETKRGKLINVTEELVAFDQTGQVLDRARNIGEAARQDRERRIVQGVIDHDSGEAIYQPGGTAEQLYASANNNVDTSTGALQDYTDIQSVMDFHANNITDDRQTGGGPGAQPLVWMPKILLVSQELRMTALNIINATQVEDNTGSNVSIAPNPVPGLQVLSSVFINSATTGDQWDDNSDWLLGDFQKQFRYKEIWPLQTFRAPAQNDQQFEKDIVARFKVREYGDVLALDQRWVIKIDVS